MQLKITGLIIQVAEYVNYRPVPIQPRDLKALAAYLNALADAPQTLTNTRIGVLGINMNVEEVAEKDGDSSAHIFSIDSVIEKSNPPKEPK